MSLFHVGWTRVPTHNHLQLLRSSHRNSREKTSENQRESGTKRKGDSSAREMEVGQGDSKEDRHGFSP